VLIYFVNNIFDDFFFTNWLSGLLIPLLSQLHSHPSGRVAWIIRSFRKGCGSLPYYFDVPCIYTSLRTACAYSRGWRFFPNYSTAIGKRLQL